MAETPATTPPTLTKKQTAFRDAILSGFTPSEAYRKAFDAKAMSKRAVCANANKLLKHKKVALSIRLAVTEGKQSPIGPPLTPTIQMSMSERLEELRCAARLDPADAFDELNHFKSIREMPEHVRRAIAGFEVDPVSFVIKVKFVDKRGAIMDYSKLAGDIPRETGPGPQERPKARLPWESLSLTERLELRSLIAQFIEAKAAGKTLNAPKIVNQGSSHGHSH